MATLVAGAYYHEYITDFWWGTIFGVWIGTGIGMFFQSHKDEKIKKKKNGSVYCRCNEYEQIAHQRRGMWDVGRGSRHQRVEVVATKSAGRDRSKTLRE